MLASPIISQLIYSLYCSFCQTRRKIILKEQNKLTILLTLIVLIQRLAQFSSFSSSWSWYLWWWTCCWPSWTRVTTQSRANDSWPATTTRWWTIWWSSSRELLAWAQSLVRAWSLEVFSSIYFSPSNSLEAFDTFLFFSLTLLKIRIILSESLFF